VRLLIFAALGAAALAVLASAAGATNECRGFQVCAPVAGPWVVVPSGTRVPRPQVEYVLSCPKGYVVGGLDAELTDASIDVTFQALIGSPVNPGISTSRAAVFVATSVRATPALSSFRPHIGCIPGGGGGQRIPTVYRVVPPGRPSVRRVWTVHVTPGTRRVTEACAAGETLVSAWDAVGFYTKKPPTSAEMASVQTRLTVASGRVHVSIRAGAAVKGANGIVQVSAVCGGGA
jgi:hypothetical protein